MINIFNYSAIKSIEKTDEIFKNIQDLVKKACFVRQQLKYEESKRQSTSSGSQSSSVYKRLSGSLSLKILIEQKVCFNLHSLIELI